MNWNAVYDILQEECGATNYWRENFVYCLTHDSVREYRFQGSLEFGGKFRQDLHRGRFWVDCYREDETPERLTMISRANERLKLLSIALAAAGEQS